MAEGPVLASVCIGQTVAVSLLPPSKAVVRCAVAGPRSRRRRRVQGREGQGGAGCSSLHDDRTTGHISKAPSIQWTTTCKEVGAARARTNG